MLRYFAPPRYCPTTTAVLKQAGAIHTTDPLSDWDLFLAASSAQLDDLLPSRTDQWIGRMPGAGWLSHKAMLWKGLCRAVGRPRAVQLMPETWLMPEERARLAAAVRPGMVLIAKNPVLEQRRGLRLCADLAAVDQAAAAGMVVVQRLLEDLQLIRERRFHLRIFVLLVRRDGSVTVWRHEQGRCIWAPQPISGSLMTPAAVITRGSALPPGLPITTAGLQLLRFDFESLKPRIDALLADVLRPMLPLVARGWSLSDNPAFHLLGADIVVDRGGGVRLIELNSGPDLRPRSDVDGQMKRAVFADILHTIDLKQSHNNGFQEIMSSS